MSIVKRRRDAIDALEHAMGGVQTTEEKPAIEQRDHDPGIIGKRSDVRIDIREDNTPVEREVTVVMPRLPRRRDYFR
jgi:hypothetical protein